MFRKLFPHIVNLRTELPEIYRKFGFVETGKQSAQVITDATEPIHFITMSSSGEDDLPFPRSRRRRNESQHEEPQIFKAVAPADRFGV